MRRELEVVLQLAAKIPLADVPEFLGDLDSIRNRTFVRMLTPPPAPEDKLLNVAKAAKRLGCSKQYLYSHHKTLPFTRQAKIGRKLLFSSSGITEYLKQKSQ